MINRFSPSRRKPRASLVATAVAAASLAVASNAAFAVAPVIATPTSALTAYPSGADTFAIGADGHVRELSYAANVWTSFDVTASLNAVPAVAGSALSSVAYANYPYHVFYLSADGHVQGLIRSNNVWSIVDISASAGAVPAVAGSPLTSIGIMDGHFRIYYVDASGHVRELADNGHGGWVGTDLSSVTASVGAAPGSALTSLDHTEDDSIGFGGAVASPDSDYPRVYYFSRDGHVQELAYGNSTWHLTDVTASSGGVPAVGGSAITSLDYEASGSTKYPRVYYFDVNGHVQEMAWGSGWHATDISSKTGAVAAVRGSGLASFALGANAPRVYYVSYEGHVRELAWNGGWGTSDIASQTCAAPAAAGSALVSFYYSTPSGVAYLSADSHIHELVRTSNWTHQDLNGAGTPQGCTSSGGGGGGGGGGTHQLN